MAKKVKKQAVKRAPKKYDKVLCDDLIAHMKEGLGFKAACAEIGIHHSTGYDWCERYPEWKEAKLMGLEYSRLFWEKLGIKLARYNEGNATAYIFNMANRFSDEWRRGDKEESTSKDININVKYDPRKKKD